MALAPARVARVLLILLVVGAPVTVTMAFESAAKPAPPSGEFRRDSVRVSVPARKTVGGADAIKAIERTK